MKKITVLIIVTVVFSIPGACGFYVISDDTYVDISEPNYCFGQGTSLMVQSGTDEQYLLIWWEDLPEVDEATLYIYNTGASDPANMQLYSITGDGYNEMNTTWNHQPSVDFCRDLDWPSGDNYVFDITPEVNDGSYGIELRIDGSGWAGGSSSEGTNAPRIIYTETAISSTSLGHIKAAYK